VQYTKGILDAVHSGMFRIVPTWGSRNNFSHPNHWGYFWGSFWERKERRAKQEEKFEIM
jgi:hypothetical protein